MTSDPRRGKPTGSRQPIEAQRGEIEFRRLLVRQQVEGERIFEDEFSPDGIRPILARRMTDTVTEMRALQARGIPLGVWLELGAERGQRALVLENDFAEHGAAADLSLDMLRSAAHWAKVFDRPRLPLRVCSDVHRLPFRSGSLPFVFCFEFLHHFPDPAPAIAEARRVLAPGGWFVFDEEPYQKVLKLRLLRGRPLYSSESLRAHPLRRLFDRFFTEPACNEERYGIIENHSIPLAVWRRALAGFATRDVRLRSLGVLHSRLFGWREPLGFVLTSLLGGRISGVCRVAGDPPPPPRAIEETLICPDCLGAGSEHALDRVDEGWRCGACGTLFPVVADVAVLLPRASRAELYPELEAAVTS